MTMHPLVLVDGPPHCGKTTLARQLAASSSAGAILARAGSPEGRRIMANPLSMSAARPVILAGATMDEARILTGILAAQPSHGFPGQASIRPATQALVQPPVQPSFQPLVISAAMAAAQPTRLPRFVLVGGPFRQISGRAGPDTPIKVTAHLSLGSLTLAEVGRASVRAHWLRGGYPEAYTAENDSASMTNLANLIAGLSGGLLLPWGLPASPTRLATVLASLAEAGGTATNENALARMLGTSRPTVCRWMEGLEHAGLLRRVPRLPGKGSSRRTVQAPAWHIRDSGLIHGLVGIHSATDLRSLPRLAAASWLAYVLEQTAAVLPEGTALGSYLSADGACIELVLIKNDKVIAATTKPHVPVSPGRGVTLGAEAVSATDRFIVVPDGFPRNIGGNFRIIGLADFLDEVCKLDT